MEGWYPDEDPENPDATEAVLLAKQGGARKGKKGKDGGKAKGGKGKSTGKNRKGKMDQKGQKCNSARKGKGSKVWYGKNGSKGKGMRMKCFFCDEPGHTSTNCQIPGAAEMRKAKCDN